MCGIVAMMNPKGVVQVALDRVFKELLFADTLRGPHSTGVFKVKKNKIDWRKAAEPTPEFMKIPNVQDFMKDLDEFPYVVGHNRWATKGAINNDNAHPFEIKHITLVHNGTLWSAWNLPDNDKFQVDSECIANAFAEKGPENVIPLLRGAFALVWYDSKLKQLSMIRNKERPLYLAKMWNNVYFAVSEKEMLEWIIERNKGMLESCEMIPPYQLTTFELGREKPKIKMLKEEFPVSTQIKYYGFGGLNDDEEEIVNSFKNDKKQKENVIPFKIATPLFDSGKMLFMGRPRTASMMRVGDLIEFSLFDYLGDSNGKFLPIEGRFIDDDKGDHFIIKGNFSGTEEQLMETRKLFIAEITAVNTNHKNLVTQIDVKGIKIGEKDDPAYIPRADKEVKQTEEEKKEIKGSYIFCHTKTCGKQLNPDSQKINESGMIVFKTGGARRFCVDCFMKEVPNYSKRGANA